MNIVEKILARASGKSSVAPDDVVFADVDKVMMHDVLDLVYSRFLIN